MIERRRLTIVVAALAAVVLLGGTVAVAAFLPPAGGQPPAAQASPEAKEKPSAEKVHRILEGLKNAGIGTTTEEFSALADKYGVGGAVRVLAFADASGKTAAQISALRDAGKGWGAIRRELGISIGPGIGWLMGRGHGHEASKSDKGTGSGDDEDDGDD